MSEHNCLRETDRAIFLADLKHTEQVKELSALQSENRLLKRNLEELKNQVLLKHEEIKSSMKMKDNLNERLNFGGNIKRLRCIIC